ncbi:MAG: FG-GAP-like repeat-containing protein, partial [Planctomycetota bacterium]
AKRRLNALLIDNPESRAAKLLSVRLAVGEGRWNDAADLLFDQPFSRDASEERELLIALTLRSIDPLADHTRVAWSELEALLQARPKLHSVRRALTQFLNRIGHRHRACQHAEWLCKAGVAGKEELQSLLARRSSFPEASVAYDSLTDVSDLTDAEAFVIQRRLYTDNRFSEAADLWKRRSSPRWSHPEHAALGGEILARAQRLSDLPAWLASCPTNTDRYAAYWSALGIWLEMIGEHRQATGAFLKAIEIDPTGEDDYRRLAFCFSSLDKASTAERVRDRGMQLQTATAQALLAESDQDNAARYLAVLSNTLNDLGRPFEFIGWQLYLSKTYGAPPGYSDRLDLQRQKLASMPDYGQMSLLDRRVNLTSKEYPAPSVDFISRISPRDDSLMDLGDRNDGQPAAVRSMPDEELRLVDVAAEVGLDFRFFNRPVPIAIDMRIFESLGGGIAVLDFDLDGRPDLAFNQAGGVPPAKVSQRSNQLYRNLGSRLTSVESQAGCLDFGYSTGIACGDVNQDGFPDLFIAALGRNRLLINRGDGTFGEADLEINDHRFTGSVAIADVSGDQLPDLISTNYVDDPVMYRPLVRKEG